MKTLEIGLERKSGEAVKKALGHQITASDTRRGKEHYKCGFLSRAMENKHLSVARRSVNYS